MKRTYIDNLGIIHKYDYDKDNIISKAKCTKCYKKMNYVFVYKLGKHIKLGFMCFNCNIVYVNDNYTAIKCKISILPIKRINLD